MVHFICSDEEKIEGIFRFLNTSIACQRLGKTAFILDHVQTCDLQDIIQEIHRDRMDQIGLEPFETSLELRREVELTRSRMRNILNSSTWLCRMSIT